MGALAALLLIAGNTPAWQRDPEVRGQAAEEVAQLLCDASDDRLLSP